MDKNKSIRFPIALYFAKGVNKLIDIIDKNRGSNFSGEKALLIDPQMVKHFSGVDPEKVIFITGTNGKTSCTHLVTHMLRENGFKVISNLEGANLLAGINTSLIKASDIKGHTDADFYVFETDERFLPLIYEQLPSRNLLIMNLQKDQVQRNGDPDFIYRKLDSFINPKIRLFLNSDEPKAKSFETRTDDVVYFGVEANNETFKKDQSFPTEACPHCHSKIDFDYYNVDGVGHFKCSNCGFSSEEKPDYYLQDINYDDKVMTVNGVTGKFPYNFPFMLYNYAAALALGKEVANLSEEEIINSFSTFDKVEGRFETFEYGGKKINYLRFKQENPDTLQNALNTIAMDKEPKDVLLGLYPIHDITPAYTNTFYTYDCDFKPLIDSNVSSFYCFSPTVCYDIAQRLKLEGIDEEKIEIAETDDPEIIFNRIMSSGNDNIYLITWMHNFEELKKYAQKHKKDSNEQ